MGYEELILEAHKEGLTVKEKPLQISDGLIKGKKIAIRKNIPTSNEKADVLAEELGHYFTSVGNIIELFDDNAVKQEQTARLWAYNKRFGLIGILKAFQAHCSNVAEIAEYLEISEEFLTDGLERYRQIYGRGTTVDNYFIQFEPHLQVYEYIPL